jgi:hypothetical protein
MLYCLDVLDEKSNYSDKNYRIYNPKKFLDTNIWMLFAIPYPILYLVLSLESDILIRRISSNMI